MKNRVNSVSIILLFNLMFCIGTSFAAIKDTLYASSLIPIGRYDLTPNDGMELICSAVHFGFRFKGRSCLVDAFIKDAVGHNYIQYTLDGVYQKRLRVNGYKSQPLVIEGLTDSEHRIWIYKATEAATGPVFIRKIIASGITPLKIPALPLIEYIGNSITCGAASDPSEIPCGAGEYHDQHNAFQAYGPRLARSLNMNFILSSVSGIGIYRNWNSQGPVMPQVYEKTDFDDNGKRFWDFKRYRPRIVSMALGTNDFSDGDGIKPRLAFDSAHYVNNYIGFVKLVRSKYPDARIVLLSSPMLNGEKRQKLQNCLLAVQKTINSSDLSKKKIVVFFLSAYESPGLWRTPQC